MKNILVTGASGFIGYELCLQLAKAGYEPVMMVRRPLRAGLLAKLPGRLVQADLESFESLERATKGIDTIIHLGARAIFEEYSLVKPTIVDGSISLMEAGIKNNVKKFVLASSLLVYGNQKDVINQETPERPDSGYGKAKLEAEGALRSMGASAGVDFAAIRLPHVYGARDLMFKEVRSGRVAFPGSGKNLYAHMHVIDSARLLIAVAEQGWTGSIPVADYQPADWWTFFNEIRKYYPRFKVYGIPLWLSLMGTHLFTPIRRLSKHPSLYTPQAVTNWNLNLPVAKGLLWEELRLEPEYSTIFEGIPAVMDECVAFQWLHPLEDKKS